MLINCNKFVFLFLIAFPLVTLIAEKSYVVRAEDDVDNDDDGVDIEPDGTEDVGDTAVTEEDDATHTIGKSPDGESTILFIKPRPGLVGLSGAPELHAGKVVEFLVGFTNKGKDTFTLESLDASFRYPQDYSFHIQNFTAAPYNRPVKPKEQVTLSYTFYTDESFAGRPFGLVVSLGYRDSEGKPYLDAVFNETVSIVELEEGLDGETFFLYVLMAAFVVLMLVVGQHLLSQYGPRKAPRKQQIERGTSDSDDVDFEWIPKETLREVMKKSPGKSPKSPKQRRPVKKEN
jgi:translocon-associated protein subunit alpha